MKLKVTPVCLVFVILINCVILHFLIMEFLCRLFSGPLRKVGVVNGLRLWGSEGPVDTWLGPGQGNEGLSPQLCATNNLVLGARTSKEFWFKGR